MRISFNIAPLAAALLIPMRLHVALPAVIAVPVFLHAAASTAEALDSSDFTGQPDYGTNDNDDPTNAVEPPSGFGASRSEDEPDVDREEEEAVTTPYGISGLDAAIDGLGAREPGPEPDSDREAEAYDTDGDGLPDQDDPRRGK